MLRILQMLILGHYHTWNIKEKITIVNDKGQTVGTKYHMQCLSCGEIKAKEL